MHLTPIKTEPELLAALALLETSFQNAAREPNDPFRNTATTQTYRVWDGMDKLDNVPVSDLLAMFFHEVTEAGENGVSINWARIEHAEEELRMRREALEKAEEQDESEMVRPVENEGVAPEMRDVKGKRVCIHDYLPSLHTHLVL